MTCSLVEYFEFMRPWTEHVYGIPPEQAIGRTGGLKFKTSGSGPVIVKLPQLVLNDDKEGKPVGIRRHIVMSIVPMASASGPMIAIRISASSTRPRRSGRQGLDGRRYEARLEGNLRVSKTTPWRKTYEQADARRFHPDERHGGMRIRR